MATADDIEACFRLLLGRLPNPEERPGHLRQVGQELSRVVAGYVNSLEFARRGLMQLGPSAPTIADIDGIRLYASADDAAVGRHVIDGSYEPDVAAVFRRLLRPGMGVVDVGANIGYFSMLAARIVGPAGYVLAVEPNPANARSAEASRQLNGFEHVSVVQVAAGLRAGVLMLNTTHSNGTTAAITDGPQAVLAAQTVGCVPLDSLIETGRRIDLIKIDVEGAEGNVLAGAEGVLARCRPAIVSEFSPGLLPGISGVDGPGYLEWLHRRGYKIAVIQPDGGLGDAGQDVNRVMEAYERRGTDHIDLLATV